MPHVVAFDADVVGRRRTGDETFAVNALAALARLDLPFRILAYVREPEALPPEVTESGQVVPYAAFIAPALLAVSAMNGAVYDSTWNVFFKMNFAKLYQGMLYTSLGPLDVAMGEILLALLRGAMYATGFTAVMGVMGLITTPWAILMIPASVLIAFGFARFLMGITSFMKTFQQMDWINFVMLPMFLSSATFYPLTV